MIDNPLEQTMGIYQHGQYKGTPPNTPFAFERVEDMWQDEETVAAVDVATMIKVDVVADEARTTLVPVRRHQRVDSALLLATMCLTMDTRQPQIRCNHLGRSSNNTFLH